MNDLRQRACNAMFGLAVGDALSWPAMFHRSYLLPFWTRRIRREIEAASETTQVIRPAAPFSLNRPATAFALGPTDDTEWAAFTAQQLLFSGGKLDAQKLLEAWLQLARASQNVRGGVSQQAALANLRQGKLPPQTGRDNPHYFDDGAVCRAVPIGIICAGQPHAAAEMADLEASVTNAEDGLWAAQAMAAAISVACVGANVDAVIATAMSQLPNNTWIERSVAEALQFCRNDQEVFGILPRLSERLINREYSYGSVAPETFALALVIIKLCRADFKSAVLAAAAFAKTADSVPAMVGALTGAMTAQEIISPNWREQFRHLQGICLPNLAGINYVELSEQLADLAMRKMQQE